MKFDPCSTLMINRGDHILIVFYLYICHKYKYKSSAILMENVVKLARFVTLTF